MFDSLGRHEEIVSLEDLHIPFNPQLELERNEKSAAEQYRYEYVMTPFLQSTQAWKWRMEEEERQRYADKLKREDAVGEREEVHEG